MTPPKMTADHLRLARAVIDALPRHPLFVYFHSLTESDLYIGTTETEDDTLFMGVFTIRAYTDTVETTRTLLGTVSVERTFYEACVEVPYTGDSRWEPDDTVLSMIDPHCVTFDEALERVIVAYVEDHVRDIVHRESMALAAAGK